jgi:hypothetical protein
MPRKPYGKEKRTEQIAVKAPPSVKETLSEIAEEREWTLSQTALKMIEMGIEMYRAKGNFIEPLRKTA